MLSITRGGGTFEDVVRIYLLKFYGYATDISISVEPNRRSLMQASLHQIDVFAELMLYFILEPDACLYCP